MRSALFASPILRTVRLDPWGNDCGNLGLQLIEDTLQHLTVAVSTERVQIPLDAERGSRRDRLTAKSDESSNRLIRTLIQ